MIGRFGSRRALAILGAFALVLIVVVGLALGPLHSAGAPAQSSPPPSQAAGSPTAAATPTPSMAALSPSLVEPPTDDTSTRTAAVLASVDCPAVSGFDNPTAVSGDLLYVACASGRAVLAINLSTDTISKIQPLSRPPTTCQTACPPLMPDGLVVDGGMWVHWTDGYLQRLDMDTGQTTTDAQGVKLVGDAFGIVWVQAKPDEVWEIKPQGPLPAVKATAGTWDRFFIACGEIWDSWSGKNGTTVLARVDRVSGATTKPELTVPATIKTFELVELDSACWLAGLSTAGTSNPWHVARMSFTGASACFSPAWVSADRVPFALDDTDWFWDGDSLVQLDMSNAQKIGRHWTMPTPHGKVVAAKGQVWAQIGSLLQRVDIPLDPIPSKADLPPFVCG